MWPKFRIGGPLHHPATVTAFISGHAGIWSILVTRPHGTVRCPSCGRYAVAIYMQCAPVCSSASAQADADMDVAGAPQETAEQRGMSLRLCEGTLEPHGSCFVLVPEEKQKLKFVIDTLDHPDPFAVQVGPVVTLLRAIRCAGPVRATPPRTRRYFLCSICLFVQVEVPENVRSAIDWIAKRSASEAMQQREAIIDALEKAAAGLRLS